MVLYQELTVNDRELKVYLSRSLKKQARKSKTWKSKEFCITLRNVKYGLDGETSRSKGGRDGVYLLDRNFTPRNEMQKRIFDRFIDSQSSDYSEILKALKISHNGTQAIRVVSHHMRLVGIYRSHESEDILVLVDVDTKH